jgi:predicted secreted protein
MNPFTGIATLFSLWWIVLFVTLPMGVRSQEESGEVVAGSERGAPTKPDLLRKAILTTIITVVLWSLIWWGILSGVIDFQKMPFGIGPQ